MFFFLSYGWWPIYVIKSQCFNMIQTNAVWQMVKVGRRQSVRRQERKGRECHHTIQKHIIALYYIQNIRLQPSRSERWCIHTTMLHWVNDWRGRLSGARTYLDIHGKGSNLSTLEWNYWAHLESSTWMVNVMIG